MYRESLALLASFVALESCLVHGATISYTVTLGPHTDDYREFSATIPQFDPTRGSLHSVTFSKFAPVTPSGIAENNGSTTRTFQGLASGILRYRLPGINATTDFPGSGRRFDLLSEQTSLSRGQSVRLSFPSATLRPFDEIRRRTDAGFQDYIGAGSVTLTYSYLYGVRSEPQFSSIFVSGGLIESLTGTLTYDYTPVPESTSAVLALWGTVAISHLRRTKHSTRRHSSPVVGS